MERMMVGAVAIAMVALASAGALLATGAQGTQETQREVTRGATASLCDPALPRCGGPPDGMSASTGNESSHE